MECEYIFFHICFVKANPKLDNSIFGFGEFISALALLVIVYTISDIRYKFRISIAPGNLLNHTFILIGVIGASTLIADVWISEQWIIPYSLISYTSFQAMLGVMFLGLAMTWIYHAFLNPPLFNKKNYKEYVSNLYKIILKGSNIELAIMADEFSKSIKPLLKYYKEFTLLTDEQKQKKEIHDLGTSIYNYTHDALLLIGNRKFCKKIIDTSPGTAITLFDTVSSNTLYDAPIGTFSKNISSEAISNKDSILYHENDGHYSGLLGYIKPFSNSVFGNYMLVEELGRQHGSPYDIDYRVKRKWDAEQLETYLRCLSITIESYLEQKQWGRHSFVLFHTMHDVDHFFTDITMIDRSVNLYNSDSYRKLQACIEFIKQVVDIIKEQETIPRPQKLRLSRNDISQDLYDLLANIAYEAIFKVSRAKLDSDDAWQLHYSTVWSPLFTFPDNSKPWKIIHFKIRRLLYNDIYEMNEFPNYKGATILGYCLNIFGLKEQSRNRDDRNEFALKKCVLEWTKNNYIKLREELPDVADAVLIGRISFDEKNSRLVKTYTKGLEQEAPKEYLAL